MRTEMWKRVAAWTYKCFKLIQLFIRISSRRIPILFDLYIAQIEIDINVI